MKKFLAENFKYLAIIAVSLFFRLIYLGVVPVSLAHDEIDNIIQSYSVKFTGQDINKSWHPLSLLPNDGVMAELSPIINLLSISILPNSIFTAHLTTAILSSLYPAIIVLLLMNLGIPSAVSWITGWLLVLSPWHIIFSRTTLEQPTSLFFYTLSWLFLTRLIKTPKSKIANSLNTLFFTLSYVIGFSTYHGYKFALPLLTLMVISYLVLKVKNSNIISIKLFVVPTIIVLGILLRIMVYSDHYTSRQSEIILNQTDKFAQMVDNDRRISLAPSSVKSVFSNKYTVILDTLKSKYLMTISPNLLYTTGEKNGVFSVGRMGYIYLIFLPFIILGLTYLIYHRKAEHLLLLGLLIFSPIASVIHINDTIAFRSGIYFVLLNIVIAYGIYAVHSQVKSKIILYILGFFMLTGFARFLYVYFTIYPVESASAYFLPDRLLGQYLYRSSNKKILVIDSQPRYILSNIIMSKSNITESDLELFRGDYSPSDLNTFHFNDIDIMRSCPKESIKDYDSVIISRVLVEPNLDCPSVKALKANKDTKIRSIVSPLDSGLEKLLIGDTLCGSYQLPAYIHPTSLTTFDLTSLSNVQFCNSWIVEQ